MKKENKDSEEELNKKKNNLNQKDEKDSEKKPNGSSEKNYRKKSKIKIFTKKTILLFVFPLFIAINIYLVNNNTDLLELNERIKDLESKIEAMDKNLLKKKISIAFVSTYFRMYSIARYISVLSDLLVKQENMMFI